MGSDIFADMKSWAPIISLLSLGLSIWTFWDGRRRSVHLYISKVDTSTEHKQEYSVWVINLKNIAYLHSLIIYGIKSDNSYHEIYNINILRHMQRGEVLESRVKQSDTRSFEAIAAKIVWHKGKYLWTKRIFVNGINVRVTDRLPI